MGRFGKVVLQVLLIIFLYGCGSILRTTHPRQKIPMDRYYSINEVRIDDKQRFFLTLYDPTDNLIYDNYHVEPDSIVCYIDSFLTAPTLIINRVYIEQTEYRYHDQQLQRRGIYPPGTDNPKERFATINYRVPVLVYRFAFSSLQQYETMIPERLRSRTQIKYVPPLQLYFK